MSVPNTDTFSMQDVITEIGSGDDLVELFSLATGTFDPAYVGDKTNLLNFRNYSHTFSWVETFSVDVVGDNGWTDIGADGEISGGALRGIYHSTTGKVMIDLPGPGDYQLTITFLGSGITSSYNIFLAGVKSSITNIADGDVVAPIFTYTGAGGPELFQIFWLSGSSSGAVVWDNLLLEPV